MSVLDRYKGWIRGQQVQMEVLETDIVQNGKVLDLVSDADDPEDNISRELMAERETMKMLLGQNPAVLPLPQMYNMLHYAERKAEMQNDESAASGIYQVMLSAYGQIGTILVATLTQPERARLRQEAQAAGKTEDHYVWGYIEGVLQADWEANG